MKTIASRQDDSQGIPFWTGTWGCLSWPFNHSAVYRVFDDWDLFWVLQGTMSWEITGGQRLLIRKGDLAILPPFHSAIIRQHKSPLKFNYCHFSFRLPLQGNQATFQALQIQLPRIPNQIRVFSGLKTAPLKSTYKELFAIGRTQPTALWDLEIATLRLVKSLANLSQSVQSKNPSQDPFPSIMDRRVALVSRRISENPSQRWIIRDLGREVGLSPGHLYTLFKKSLGKTIKQFIIDQRLRLGLQRLKEPGRAKNPSVKEVSEACGFSSQHFFCRQFKKHFGVPPSKYRQDPVW